MKRHIANSITAFRILCSIMMLFSPIFSPVFHITYLLCGLSDMADGFIARKTNTCSDFGSAFDSVADFIFFTLAFIKVLPEIHLPEWLWIWISVIAVVKITIAVRTLLVKTAFTSLHTSMNKLTGFLVFLFPLTLNLNKAIHVCIAVCFFASLTVIRECIGKIH